MHNDQNSLLLFKIWSNGAVSVRPVSGLKPIFFLILLTDPLYIGVEYANSLLEWNNRLEDIFKLSGWGNYPL